MQFVLSLPTLLVLVPAAGGLIATCMLTKRAASVVSLLTFIIQAALIGVGVAMLRGAELANFSLSQRLSWLPAWGISFDVQLGAAALGLISLTTLVTACVAWFAWWVDRDRPAAVHGLLWFSAAAICGMFVARDLVLFYTFFELMLLPLLIYVGRWGGEQRVRAALTMIVYTLLGSLPMLVGVLAVGLAGGTFSIDQLAASAQAGTLDVPAWALPTFLLAFAIKAPLFPFHGWLPLVYREAPVEGTALLSGVVSKAAMFGMLLVVLPLFAAQLAGVWGDILTWMALISLLYASLAAFRQPDARGVIAYSSMAQMGLILLGLSVYLGDGAAQGLSGAYMQTINHGLISAAMFLIAGIVEHRAGTGQLARLGGLATGRPVLASTLLVVSMCALAVPGSNAFAGEFTILLGTWRADSHVAWLWAVLGSLAVVLAAMYVLRLLSAVMHTPQADTEEHSAEARERFGADVGRRELAMLLPLVIAMLALSVWPNMLHRPMSEHPVTIAAPADDTNKDAAS